MMQFFRSAAKPIILVTTIAFFVWLVYDLSGLGNGGGLLTKTSVGKVNGSSVDARTFQATVQQTIEARQRQTGASLSLEEVAQVRDQVWEQAIQDIIFRAEYRRNGIRVTSAEVTDAIRSSPPRELAENPQFQTDGKFDPVKYQRWLGTATGQSAVPYLEEQYRAQLMQGKLLRTVIGDVAISDPALWERYRDEKETVKVGALKVDPAVAIADNAITVTPQEVDEYYRTHRDDFKRPKAAYLSYVSLPRLPDASDTAAALARANSIRDQIAKGTPFDEAAKRESADTISGKNGGDLGEMNKGAVDPLFGTAVMSLPLNSLSEPVRSSFGFHLIEVQSRKGDTFKAKHILIPIEVTGSHRDLLDRRADSLEQLAAERLEGSALDTAASALKLAIRKMGPVLEGVRMSTMDAGNVPDVGVWAFQAKPGEESSVIEAERAYVLARLDSAQAEGIPLLEAIRAGVEARVRLEKKKVAAKELATKLVQQARSGGSLKQLAQGTGLTYQEMGPFARLSSPLPDPSLIGAAFGATGGPSGPVSGDDGVYVFEQLARTAADSADFVKNVAAIREQALQQARQSRVRAYLAALRTSAKVVDRRADIYKTNAQAAQSQPQVPVR